MTQTRASITQNRNAAIAALDQQIADLQGLLEAVQQARTGLFIWSTSEEPMDLDHHPQARRTIKDIAAKMTGNGQ